jgi:O-antigen ligase
MFFLRELFPIQPSDYFSELPIVQKLAIICICLLPIFHLTFDDWTGYWVVWSFFLCLISTFQNKKSIKIIFADPCTKWVAFGLIAYPLAVFISQLCRWSFTHKAYLDAGQFLYFIPVFIFVIWQRIDMGKWLQLILPIVIIGAFWSTFYNHRELVSSNWGNERHFPYFLDPLAFGQTILSLSLMSLSTINFKELLPTIWSITGFSVGIFLSIQSGSRTGWMAIPFSLFFILIIKLNWGFRKSCLLAFTLSILSCVCFYYLSSTVHSRVDQTIHELLSYPWHSGIGPDDSSTGQRITFLRLGWFYFSQSPIFGWGNAGYAAIKDAPEVLSFSSQFARDFVYKALFHNELMTQMVRYGFLGICGYIFAVIVPFVLCIKHLRSSNEIISRSTLMCFIFLICQIISGFSNEFLNLKGMVCFYAYLISILLGTVIGHSKTLQSNRI